MRFGSVCSGIEAASGWRKDLTGHRNGRLVAVRCIGAKKGGHALWLCRCDCGSEKVVQSNNLQRDSGTKSCGCLRREAAAARLKRDGAWNESKSYAIGFGGHCYRSRAAWAKAVIRHYCNRCMSCGWDKARCDAHHRIPKSEGGSHTIANGRVLCPNCHRIEHEGAR